MRNTKYENFFHEYVGYYECVEKLETLEAASVSIVMGCSQL